MLQPLKSRSELKAEINMPEVWDYLMERPIGEVIKERFKDDLVRGVVLTDALIGTFSSAFEVLILIWKKDKPFLILWENLKTQDIFS